MTLYAIALFQRLDDVRHRNAIAFLHIGFRLFELALKLTVTVGVGQDTRPDALLHGLGNVRTAAIACSNVLFILGSLTQQGSDARRGPEAAGAGDIDGTGNVQADIITGNAETNTLSSGNGNDVPHGEGGADVLAGGAGDNTFVFETGGGADTVVDLGADGSITLTGIDLASLHQDDFRFV